MGDLGREFFWIVADFRGRLVILGPLADPMEAQNFAYQKLDCPFEIVPLKTRDRAKASAMIKAKKLANTGNLGNSIQRSMRKAPEDYQTKWWGGQSG